EALILEFCWHGSWSINADLTPQARAWPPWRTTRAFLEATMFRISRTGWEEITDVALLDGTEPAAKASKPGHYHVDQIERDVLPSGHTSLRWGVAIKHPDGSVLLEPDPWER